MAKMVSEKRENVFSDFYLFPTLSEWKHAKELIKLSNGSTEAGQNSSTIAAALSNPPRDLNCHLICNTIESNWLKEVERCGPKRASLSRVLLKMLIPDFVKQILLYIIFRLGASFCILEVTRSLLIYIEESDLKSIEELELIEQPVEANFSQVVERNELQLLALGSTAIDRNILTYLIMLSISTLSYTVCLSWLTFGGLRIGLKSRTLLTKLVQKKSLKLHLFSDATHKRSRAAELISNEITFIEEASRYITFTFTGPICLICCLIWLSLRVTDWRASVATLPLILIFLLFKIYLMKIRKKTNSNRREETKRRIGVTGAFLNSIKVIKMYAWERPFRDRIQAFRVAELNFISKLDTLTVLDFITSRAASTVIPTVPLLIAIYCRSGFNVQSLFLVPLSQIFFSLDYILQLSRAIQGIGEFVSSCGNIKKYLLLEELKDQRKLEAKNIVRSQDDDQFITCNELFVSNQSQSTRELELCRETRKSSRTQVIQNFTAKFQPSELVIVIGRVGSGKSTLLLTLLGETHITAGSLRLPKSTVMSYASQEPWILSRTFKENILFGREFDADRYETVIEACSLGQDISRLELGDKTCIGPRGVSLSGGQKARLNLARAVYAEADVYLLDDPLSAVDSRVAQHIFTRCIKQLLRNKLVVLATHQLQFLKQGDKVVYLEVDRKTMFGSVEEILQDHAAKDFVSSNVSQPKEHCNEDPIASQAKKSELSTIANKTSKIGSEVMVENKKVKEMSASLYVYFLKLCFGPLSLAFLLLSLMSNGPFYAFTNFHYGIWARAVFNDLHELNMDRDEFFEGLYLAWFEQLCLIFMVLVQVALNSFYLASSIRNGTRRLHEQLISSLFHAKMSFYDFCCAGELISRYAASFALVDHLLLYSAIYSFSYTVWQAGNCVMLGFIKLYGSIHIFCLYIIVVVTSRQLGKKLNVLTGLCKSFTAPVLTNLMDMTEDLGTIRSNENYSTFFDSEFNASQNRSNSITLLKLSFETMTSNIAKLITVVGILLMLVVLFSVYREDMDVSRAGNLILIVTSMSLLIPVADEYLIMLQNTMIGVEKVRQYTVLKPESSPVSSENDADKTSNTATKIKWPSGSIKFHAVTLRYFATERPVLDRLSFAIAGGEHIGVVGRTGAGKSTIISVLFRLYSYDGLVSIDGVDTGSIPLADLRASLGVIPQDPVLFSDTLRNNLDPFAEYSDEQIWRALEVVNLSGHIASELPARLEHPINEGGRNFSVGQRQLVCLARAILKSSKVLLIDEATANVDLETDSLIQQTIRRQFKESTVITIAHRLNTVLDYDRIMVLDSGRIAEFDTVEQLRSKEGGVFREMLKATNL